MAESVHKELVAPSDTRHLVRIREIVRDVASHCLETSCVNRVILAVDEAVANVMEHAYEEEPEPGDIRIALMADDNRFEIVITDTGREFNPQTIEVPDMAEHVKQGRRNGLGLFLMRQIMDEVSYTFVQGLRNELRMVKYARKPIEGGQ